MTGTITLAAAGILLALSGTALAHDPPAGEGKQVRRVIVLDGAPATDDLQRRVELMRGDKAHALRNCDGERSEIDETSGDKERTRIIICSDPNVSTADRAKRLEDALGRIRLEDDLSPEHRARVETALQQAIAKLRE